MHKQWAAERPSNLQAAAWFDSFLTESTAYALKGAVEKHLQTLQTLAICTRFLPQVLEIGMMKKLIPSTDDEDGVSQAEELFKRIVDGELELENYFISSFGRRRRASRLLDTR